MEDAFKRRIMAVACTGLVVTAMFFVANYLGNRDAEHAALLEDPSTIAHHIPKHGRITLIREEVAEQDALRITLEFLDAWQDGTPRPVRVVAGDGREISLLASKLIADQELLAVAIETDDLELGPYMIEVTSAEATPLPLRRYVFEIR